MSDLDKGTENELDIEIDIVDTTPEEDRNRTPMPSEIVKSLEDEELADYGEEVKQRFKQSKKVYHDERRARESAEREREEAIRVAEKLLDENKKLKQAYNTGEKEYIATTKQAATLEVESAKRAFKEAYESGDTEALVAAQEKLQLATLKTIRADNLKETPLQEFENPVKIAERTPQPPQPDEKALMWAAKNPWFQKDQIMTATAYGIDQKLQSEGVVAGSDEYYTKLDKHLRELFNDRFADTEAKPKHHAVVAPVSRSTASKKVHLTTEQVRLAKRLGLTNEQYALEVMKLENK